MLTELAVRNLGVIEELSLLLGPGMTAVTGETGAGKTLVVDAINLLIGGRADTGLVRPGSACAEIEGRFVGAARSYAVREDAARVGAAREDIHHEESGSRRSDLEEKRIRRDCGAACDT